MPKRDRDVFLYDVLRAAADIDAFTRDKTQDDYVSDPMLIAAVERKLTIVGEALSQALKLDPDLAEGIADIRTVIAFRNVLVHGYSVIEDDTVWGIVQSDLPALRESIERLLQDE